MGGVRRSWAQRRGGSRRAAVPWLGAGGGQVGAFRAVPAARVGASRAVEAGCRGARLAQHLISWGRWAVYRGRHPARSDRVVDRAAGVAAMVDCPTAPRTLRLQRDRLS